jgi:adenine phosphoribosyltransferase
LIQSYIRDVPDFPKSGILFKDITPLLQSPAGLKEAIAGLAAAVDPKSYDLVCGIESRGFIFGATLAHHLGKGFIPIRKPGKLRGRPRRRVTSSSTARIASTSTSTPASRIKAC